MIGLIELIGLIRLIRLIRLIGLIRLIRLIRLIELPEDKRVAAIVPWSLKLYRSVLALLEAVMAEREHLVGDGFTTADIMVGSTLMWSPDSLKSFPHLRDYVARLAARPAYARATRD